MTTVGGSYYLTVAFGVSVLGVIIIIIFIIVIMYSGSSKGSREVFQPKMPYYAKMGGHPMKKVE